MVEYTLATLPESHRRARDILRRRWSEHIDEAALVWTAIVDAKASAVALGSDRIVVVTPGLTGSEFTLPMSGVQDADTSSREVPVRDSSGWKYQIVFESEDDAITLPTLRGGREMPLWKRPPSVSARWSRS